MASALTANEVAALCGVDEARVRKEVEHGIFKRPSFDVRDLVYFAVLARLGLQLGVDDRRKLHDVLTAALASRRWPARAEISPVLDLKLDGVAKDVADRLARFEAWKNARVVSDERILGGEPVIARSRLAVRQLGEMLIRGAREKELREDYPYLKDEDIEFAPVFARAYPKKGRPRERQAADR